MTPLAVLLTSLLVVAPTSTSRTGRARTSVSVSGSVARIKQPTRSGRGLDVELSIGASCPAKKMSSVLEREVEQAGRAFGSSRDLKIQIARNARATQAFERGIAKILGNGRQRGGFTEMPGFEVPFGRLPRAGGSKSVDVPGGKSTITGLPGGGFRISTTRSGPGGVLDTSVVTLAPDGSSEVARTFGIGGRGGTVEIGGTEEHGTDGGRTSTGFEVSGQGGLMDGGVGGGGGGGSDQSSGGSKADSDPTPSGGDGGGGDDNQESGERQSSGSPGMTSEGTFVMPGFQISNAAVAEVVNWNRLGGAVTYPSPTGNDDAGADGSVHEIDAGPCGSLEDQGFDPNPKYLMPDKRGLVTDPVPALRDKP